MGCTSTPTLLRSRRKWLGLGLAEEVDEPVAVRVVPVDDLWQCCDGVAPVGRDLGLGFM